MARERLLRQVESFGEAPCGHQRAGKQGASAVGLRMIVAETPLRSRQQILAREDRHGVLILPAQRGFERLPGDHAQIDQVVADATAIPFLARQCTLDIPRGRESLRDQ